MRMINILLVVLGCAGLVFAQGAAPEKKAAATPKAPKAETIKEAKVVSTDVTANTIIISITKKKVETQDTLAVDNETVIKQGKNKVTLADLKTDAKVSVTFVVKDGKKVATKITAAAEVKKEAAPAAK